MSKMFLAALALTALVGGMSVAKADDFGGQQGPGYGAAASQSGSAQLADPTNPDSVRGHGNT